ncbi:MAG: ribonuclease P protein component [Herbaspirillum sp.]
MTHQEARSYGFSRDRRIVKTDDFSSVFRLRPVHKTAHFVLYVRPTELTNARLGVVVAKRLAARAVTRNAVKRAARELFRQISLVPMDCIVRLSRPLNSRTEPATSAALRAQIRTELVQLFAAQLPATRRQPGSSS